MLTVVEGLLESLPQFVLQVYTYMWHVTKGDMEPVMGIVSYNAFFWISVTFSVLGILKAIGSFWLDYDRIMAVLEPPVKQTVAAGGRIPKGYEGNKDVVRAAGQKHGWALQFASSGPQNDKEFTEFRRLLAFGR